MKNIIRTQLTFSATNQSHYEKSIASGADAICPDLEDSIPDDQKDLALNTLIQWLRSHKPSVDFQVRINKDSNDFQKLKAEKLLSKISSIIIPKVQDVRDITSITKNFPVFVVIEEPKAVLALESICSQKNVLGIILGRGDLSRAMGLMDRSSDLTYVLQKMAIIAHAYDKQAFDTTHMIKDEAFIRKTWGKSASFGITGAVCIHPTQVKIAKEIFKYGDPLEDAFREVPGGHPRRQGEPYLAQDGGIIGLPHKRLVRL